jgi:putative Ca2+/H+ antiporter (TMEM165/GDT1 family)
MTGRHTEGLSSLSGLAAVFKKPSMRLTKRQNSSESVCFQNSTRRAVVCKTLRSVPSTGRTKESAATMPPITHSLFDSIFSSFLLVAASEMGDKTQLLAFALAAKYKRPLPVMAGIFVATLFNHGLAAWGGSSISKLLGPSILAAVLGALFIIFALWTLKPDTADEVPQAPRFGPFLTTAFLFFMAEMGDKTQFATVALGAQYGSVLAVTFGTTLGMMLTDGLAVFAGDQLSHKINMKYMRWFAAGLFLIFGVASLWTAYSATR